VSPLRVLAVYRLIFSALIVVASLQALIAAHAGAHHMPALASIEIGGALLLGFRRTQWLGACLLLGVFVGAQLITAFEGKYPSQFLQYAASTLLIVPLDRAFAAAGVRQH